MFRDMQCNAGLPANGTIAAEVAFMFAEWYKPNAKLEFPKGGSQGIINALVRWASTCIHPYGIGPSFDVYLCTAFV